MWLREVSIKLCQLFTLIFFSISIGGQSIYNGDNRSSLFSPIIRATLLTFFFDSALLFWIVLAPDLPEKIPEKKN